MSTTFDRNTVAPINEALLTRQEVQDLLKIKESHYWALIRAGHLQAVKLGTKTVRVTAASVRRLLTHGTPHLQRGAP
jgi:excisionase family DNA binding protein